MEYFIYFLLGAAFIEWIVPIGDAVAEMIIAFFKTLTANASLKVSKVNVEIEKLGEPEPVVTHAIGFHVDPVTEEEDWEEEEDDE